MTHNKILRYYSRLADAAKYKSRLQTGFSMLEAVVVVGVLLALAVGGFFAYGPIIQNAKLAKLMSVASEVYTAATVYQVDGDPATKPQDALDAWNASSTTIKVGFFDTKIIATPAMSTAEYTPAAGEDFCIQATDTEKPEIEAKSGDCPTPPADKSTPPEEVLPEEIPNRHLEVLKNGDFSAGITYWDKIGTESGVTQTVVSGEAYLTTGAYFVSGISQKISIPSAGISHVKYTYRSEAGPTTLSVKAYDPAGNLLKTVKAHSIPVAAVPKTLGTADLSEFAGQNIKLAFEINTQNYSRNVYLDDISVQNTTETPSQPTEVTTTVTNADAEINWKTPIYGDASITSYKVTPYRNGNPLAAITVSGGPSATSTVFRGLTSGGDYTFRVTAINSIGESLPSIASEVYSRPLIGLKNGDFSVDLANWEKIGDSTTVQRVVSGEANLETNGYKTSGISQVVSVPSEGITHVQYTYRSVAGPYTFAIKAYDSAGVPLKTIKSYSIPAAATPKTLATSDLTEFAGKDIKLSFEITTANYSRGIFLDDISLQNISTAPNQPTGVTVSVTNADATINWNPPVVGAASVSSYKVTPYRNGSPLTAITVPGSPPATSTIFKGLNSGGDYTFRVTAINSIGESAAATSEVYTRPVMALKNGDFSTDLSYWERIGSGTGVTQSVVSGEASINTSGFSTSGIAQVVSIPSSGSTQVKFAYRATSGPYTFAIKAYDSAGNPLKTIKSYSIPSAATPKTVATVDLTEFAGKDIKLSFEITTANYTRGMFLDDVLILTTP